MVTHNSIQVIDPEFSIAKSKRPGWILKIALLVSLSVPLILLAHNSHYRESSRWDRVWDKSCEISGRIPLREGFIDVRDIEECTVKGDCKKPGIKLPARSVLQRLLASAKSDSQHCASPFFGCILPFFGCIYYYK